MNPPNQTGQAGIAAIRQVGAVNPTRPGGDVTRRIFGVETEYGLSSTGDLKVEEVARELFADVVAWGRSTNVFLPNGARLYLDVGSHPEYATAECATLADLISQDRAGQQIVARLAAATEARLAQTEHHGTIHVFKNNLDSAGNSFGCHENYLVRRKGDLAALQRALVPFLVTRQILVGAGQVMRTPTGARYCFSQRADHMWESISSATTRSRPLINTRDEPHADAELYRRLHVIVGDSSMSQTTTLLKIGSMDLLLRHLEAGGLWKDLELENPMAAIRAVSHDISGQVKVQLADGRNWTAAQIQAEYLDRVSGWLDSSGAARQNDGDVLRLWRAGIEAVAQQNPDAVDTELDWAIKWRLIRRYQERNGVGLLDPRVARLELAYHDISAAGLFAKLEAQQLAATVVEQDVIAAAATAPPATTRAHLRGQFITAARAAAADYTVDWLHLKVAQPDGGARVIALPDPFASSDSRVDALVASLTV